MIDLINALGKNYYYFAAIVLFLIGFHTMLTHSNLIKKVIGMNIMETAIFLFFVAIGYINDRSAPIVDGTPKTFINPLPSALILTGLVVGVSLTAFSLSLIMKLYKYYGTLDADEIMRIRSQEE
ncbi:cation:proton antiporter subunit C [Alkalicella caledoniensis]|uniref:Cation:proton antiporter subunit C n=1 Tax=Alkalicella caledoniensis TaxID=2731377 RepID=A0A7G9W4K9_ALKCA|nr:cation:proton antiporter subunit C [Alkalicella caledoniensis]QNO13621.1 cation:proton antiporter subunit C [Alkalicella caledoniensis]